MIDYTINDKNYSLTMDGRTIGEVYEREHAELIADIAHKREKEKLQQRVESLEKRELELEKENIKYSKEREELTQKIEALQMTLKKIHVLSSITSA